MKPRRHATLKNQLHQLEELEGISIAMEFVHAHKHAQNELARILDNLSEDESLVNSQRSDVENADNEDRRLSRVAAAAIIHESRVEVELARDVLESADAMLVEQSLTHVSLIYVLHLVTLVLLDSSSWWYCPAFWREERIYSSTSKSRCWAVLCLQELKGSPLKGLDTDYIAHFRLKAKSKALVRTQSCNNQASICFQCTYQRLITARNYLGLTGFQSA
jgi:hypothetical protein